MPLKTYDESLNFLRNALDGAKPSCVGGDNVRFGREKLEALRRLERFGRAVEKQLKPRAHFNKIIAHERAISPSLDGRTVMDDKRKQNFFIGRGQQKLF